MLDRSSSVDKSFYHTDGFKLMTIESEFELLKKKDFSYLFIYLFKFITVYVA